jgi:Kef-type K+ transport system membrane component KefB
MHTSRKFFGAFLISFIFLLIHTWLQQLVLDSGLMFTLILLLMLIDQGVVATWLAPDPGQKSPSFKSLCFITVLTQTFSILLLTLQAHCRVADERNHLHTADFLKSLLVFAVLLPLIFSTIYWYLFLRAKKVKKHD